MNRRHTVSALAAAVMVAGSLLVAPAYADLPRVVVDLREMDKNKNGRIEREEYLSAMAEMFDRAAGSKGYCTFEEVRSGLQQLNKVHSGA